MCAGGHQAHHGQLGKGGDCPLCSELGQLHLEGWGQFWAPQYKKGIRPLESIKRRATRMVEALEVKLYEMWLRSLVLFSLEETEARPHHGLKLPLKAKRRDRH